MCIEYNATTAQCICLTVFYFAVVVVKVITVANFVAWQSMSQRTAQAITQKCLM